ncbi:MAG: hypothetical protein ACLUOI_27135 [Eisenbergiella sp.]
MGYLFLDDWHKGNPEAFHGAYPNTKDGGAAGSDRPFAYYLLKCTDTPGGEDLYAGKELDLGWLNIPLLFFIVIER